MKVRRIVLRHFRYRFVAILCLCIGYLVWYWQAPNEYVSNRFLVNLQPEPKTITQNRNLSEYDYGGVIASCFNNPEISTKECIASQNQARDFVLRHWQNKIRAYFVLYDPYSHGVAQHVFIEPNNGRWEIVWRADVVGANTVMRGFDSNIRSQTAYFVKTKRASKDDYPYISGTSYLVFLNKNGKEIASL